MRRWRWVLAGLLLVLVTLCAWAGVQALRVRDDLTAARSAAQQARAQLRDGDLGAADASLAALKDRVGTARDRTDGFAWRTARVVPVLGRHLASVRDATTATDTVAREVLPALRGALDDAEQLVDDGVVDLPRLQRIAAALQRAHVATRQAQAQVARDRGPLVQALQKAVDQVRDQLAELDAGLTTADAALEVAPAMLGSEGPRRYFVAVQNNAEARATGGLVGSFALLRADAGRLVLERTGTDAELTSAGTPVPADPQQAAVWQRIGSTVAWFDANLTPHFPDAAQNLAGLWRAQSGQQVDGVIGLDPVVLSELLKATGPVRLGATSISSGDVVDFVGRREYVDYPDNDVRKALLAGLAKAVFDRLLAVDDTRSLTKALRASADSGHLFVWSRRSEEQQVLARGIVGGALPTEAGFLEVVTQNFGGNKLDYYLRRAVKVGPVQNGRATVTVTLTNTAPVGLPAYMTVRSDRPDPPVPYAQAKVGLALYSGLLPNLSDIRVDGKPATMQFDADQGHPFGYLTLEVPRGTPVVFSATIQAPLAGVTYRQQPLVRPDALDIVGPHRVVGR